MMYEVKIFNHEEKLSMNINTEIKKQMQISNFKLACYIGYMYKQTIVLHSFLSLRFRMNSIFLKELISNQLYKYLIKLK